MIILERYYYLDSIVFKELKKLSKESYRVKTVFYLRTQNENNVGIRTRNDSFQCLLCLYLNPLPNGRISKYSEKVKNPDLSGSHYSPQKRRYYVSLCF